MGAEHEIKDVVREMLAPNYAKQGKNYGFVDGVVPDLIEFGVKVVGPALAVKLASTALDLPADRTAIARLAAITLAVAGTQAVRDLRNSR